MDESGGGTVPAVRRHWLVRGRLTGLSLGLGLVSIVLTRAELGMAQTQSGSNPPPPGSTWTTRWTPSGSTWGNPPEPFRLTVRRAMATGTRTVRAGSYLLERDAPPASEAMPYDAVVVPEQCVGTRRCPLVVWFGDQGISSGDGPAASADFLFQTMHPLAERYGMIFLAPRYGDGFDHAANLGYLDAALQYVLRHFAIDPDKIAIAGRDGGWASAVGINNLDVFSRIAANSINAIPDTQRRPEPRQSPEYLYFQELPEYSDSADVRSWGDSDELNRNRLREHGFRVKWVVHFHAHEQREEDYAFTAHWLHESWTDPTTRPKLPVMTTLPLLTPQALTQLTTFWTLFLQLPDSIRDVARQAHLREVVVQLGPEQASAWLTDMAALAAQYPAVAAALKAAGLSAEQHDAYRLALLSAYVLSNHRVLPKASGPLAKNVEFVLGYGKVVTNAEGETGFDYEGLYNPPRSGTRNELEALWATKMFRLP